MTSCVRRRSGCGWHTEEGGWADGQRLSESREGRIREAEARAMPVGDEGLSPAALLPLAGRLS